MKSQAVGKRSEHKGRLATTEREEQVEEGVTRHSQVCGRRKITTKRLLSPKIRRDRKDKGGYRGPSKARAITQTQKPNGPNKAEAAA